MVRPAVTRGVVNDVVAVPVPFVPIIAIGGLANLVLRVISRSPNGDELPPLYRGASFGSGSLHFAFTNCHESVTVRVHLNAIASFPNRMDRNVGRVNLHVRLRVLQHGIIGQPLADLNLNATLIQGCDTRLGILIQAQDIRVVELELGSRGVAGGNFVPSHERRIQGNRGEVPRVTPLHGDVAMYEAHPGHAGIGLRSPRTRSLGCCRDYCEKRENRNCQPTSSICSHGPPRPYPTNVPHIKGMLCAKSATAKSVYITYNKLFTDDSVNSPLIALAGIHQGGGFQPPEAGGVCLGKLLLGLRGFIGNANFL